MSGRGTGAYQTIAIDVIRHRPDARHRTEEALAALADSIDRLGLINPIRVRTHGDGYEVVAGSHRLQAIESLGWTEAPCIVVDDDDLHAELAMIDENLCRAELSPADRAQQTARRKAIYLEMHPQTAAGSAGAEARWNATDNLSTASFASETAKATGKDERSVRRDAARGENIIDAALDVIRGTALDTGLYLDKLKKLSPSEQVTAAKRDLAWRKKQDLEKAEGQKRGGIAGRNTAASAPPPEPSKVFDRFVALVDEIEALAVADLVAAAGKRRSVLNQRASGLADLMDRIMSFGD